MIVFFIASSTVVTIAMKKPEMMEHQKGYAITEEQGGQMLDHPLHQPIRSKGCDMRVFFFFQLQIIFPCSRRCATCW